MGRVVVVNSGMTTDLSKLKALADKAIALVEAKLPGTTTYEFDFAVALGDPENPKASAAMQQMGFGFYGLHARTKV